MTRRFPRCTLVCLTLLLGVLAGCGTSSLRGPESTLQAYLDAARTGDARAAYTLLDERTQNEVSYEQFAQLMEDNGDELRAQAAEIESVIAEDGLTSRAEVPLQSGEQAVLRLQNGQWRLAGGVLDSPALLTPQDALLALRHALQRRDLAAVLRVLARPARIELEAEIRNFLEGTNDLLDLQIEIRGDTARVRTTDGRLVTMNREAGEWRIVEVE